MLLQCIGQEHYGYTDNYYIYEKTFTVLFKTAKAFTYTVLGIYYEVQGVLKYRLKPSRLLLTAGYVTCVCDKINRKCEFIDKFFCDFLTFRKEEG